MNRALACVLMLLASPSACRRADPPAAAANEPAVVRVQAATRETLRETVSLPGTVVPASLADLLVIAPEAARVVEVPKAEGDVVQPGDLLARFDIALVTEELAARQREFTEATSRLATAQVEATRQSTLYERGVISRNAYDASKSALMAAESALGQAKGRLDGARLIEERAIVRARFAGVVTKRWHNEGDLVAGGVSDPVLRVIDPTRIHVAVQVSAAQLARLTPGQSAMLQAGGNPAEPASLVVRPAPSESTVTTAEIRLAPIRPMALPIDTLVQVEIVIEERVDAVVIPSAAIVRDGQTSYVMIAGSDNRAHRREVRVGLLTRGLAHILSGVTAGERVIVGGLDTIVDGMAIRTGTGYPSP